MELLICVYVESNARNVSARACTAGFLSLCGDGGGVDDDDALLE